MERKIESRKVSPFIELPKCPTCESSRNVRAMNNNFFRCTCGSMFQDFSYAKKIKESRTCPECGVYNEKDNWQLHYHSGHYEPNEEKERRNFCSPSDRNCYLLYCHRVDSEKDALEKDITDGEIVSQLECPNCHKRELYFYFDDSLTRPRYASRIYQCMQCDFIVPSDQIESIIAQIRLRRPHEQSTSLSKLS